MKIGIEAHSLEGKRTGVGRYLYNLLVEWEKLLKEKGRVAANDIFLYFKDVIPENLPQIFEKKLLKTSSTAKFIHWDLHRAAAKDKVDVLFCPDYRGPIAYHGKIAVTLHDISFETRPFDFNWQTPAERILLKWASKKTAQKAKIIFVPSRFSCREVIKYYKIPASRILVTPLGVDRNLLSEIENQDLIFLRKKYNLSENFIFFVGTFFSRRHVDKLILAFENFIKEKTDWQLFLGGRDQTKGKTIDFLVEKINQKFGRQVILRVDFINDNDLRLLYRACAFFIWLSDYEGFGLPPLEAMACGAPVITSCSSSLSEVAGDAAIFIKDNSDQNEIYKAMTLLANDLNLRKELIKKGKEQARKFSWEK